MKQSKGLNGDLNANISKQNRNATIVQHNRAATHEDEARNADIPSGTWRLYNVTLMSMQPTWSCIEVHATLCKRHVEQDHDGHVHIDHDLMHFPAL